MQALESYARNRLDDEVSYQAWGWQSAKLLQTAATGNLSPEPTSQDILQGLWSLSGGQWTAPQGLTPVCG